jgi:hypothetical protein
LVTKFEAQLAEQRSSIRILMRHIYFLAKEKLALSKLSSICHLAELNKLPIGSSAQL